MSDGPTPHTAHASLKSLWVPFSGISAGSQPPVLLVSQMLSTKKGPMTCSLLYSRDSSLDACPTEQNQVGSQRP